MGVGGWVLWGFGRGSFCLVVFSLIGDITGTVGYIVGIRRLPHLVVSSLKISQVSQDT